jgi:hypothetical protein
LPVSVPTDEDGESPGYRAQPARIHSPGISLETCGSWSQRLVSRQVPSRTRGEAALAAWACRSRRVGSNHRPQPSQGCALSTELRREGVPRGARCVRPSPCTSDHEGSRTWCQRQVPPLRPRGFNPVLELTQLRQHGAGCEIRTHSACGNGVTARLGSPTPTPPHVVRDGSWRAGTSSAPSCMPLVRARWWSHRVSRPTGAGCKPGPQPSGWPRRRFPALPATSLGMGEDVSLDAAGNWSRYSDSHRGPLLGRQVC